EWRELEYLYCWLFGCVDTAIADARAVMSEIVCVCLLLASHVLVSGIVVGCPECNDTVATGQTFQVAVAQGRLAIGMVVAFGAVVTPVWGVIEDIVGEWVFVWVTAAPVGPVVLMPATELCFAW